MKKMRAKRAWPAFKWAGDANDKSTAETNHDIPFAGLSRQLARGFEI